MSSAKRTLPSSQLVAENEDLLLEILVRVPAMSLKKLKLVSGQWRSLISDSDFSRRYTLQRLDRKPQGIIVLYNKYSSKNYNFISTEPGRLPEVSIPCLKFLNPSSVYIKILQCSNGLSLCRSASRKGQYDTRVTHYVCNLATKQFKVLPCFPRRVNRVDHCMSLAFDPFISQDYKVVCAYSGRNKKILKWHDIIDVYSSETGSWSPNPITHPVNRALNRCRDSKMSWISWNGWIFWPTSPWNEQTCWYFDTDSECMKTMKLPVLQSRYRRPHFVPCASRIFIFDFDDHVVSIGSQIKVYEMKRGAPEWSLKHIVDSDEMSLRFPSARLRGREFTVLPAYVYRHKLELFAGLSADEEDDFMPALLLGNEVLIHSLKHKCSKVISRSGNRLSHSSEIHHHYETLTRP